MTMALLAVGSTAAVAATDSLETDFATGMTRTVTKAVPVGKRLAVVSGISHIDGNRTLDIAAEVLRKASHHTLQQAAKDLVDALVEFLTPARTCDPHKAPGAVLVEVGLAEPGFGLVLKLPNSETTDLGVRTLEPSNQHAAVANLGAEHPHLDPYDSTNAEQAATLRGILGDRAGWDPLYIADAGRQTLEARVIEITSAALSASSDFARPHWLPSSLAVAAGPLQVVGVGHGQST
ncbi:MAG: hypothetical protein ACXIVQ_15090 [Acidimicrobiales bacterium]